MAVSKREPVAEQEDPWDAFWRRFLELWEGWEPPGPQGPVKPA